MPAWHITNRAVRRDRAGGIDATVEVVEIGRSRHAVEITVVGARLGRRIDTAVEVVAVTFTNGRAVAVAVVAVLGSPTGVVAIHTRVERINRSLHVIGHAIAIGVQTAGNRVVGVIGTHVEVVEVTAGTLVVELDVGFGGHLEGAILPAPPPPGQASPDGPRLA